MSLLALIFSVNSAKARNHFSQSSAFATKFSKPLMGNLAQHLARLQLGASGGRHRPSRSLNEAPPININALSIASQRRSIHRSLLTSLHCPTQHVFLVRDGSTLRTSDACTSAPIFQVAYAHTSNLVVAVNEEGAAGIVHVAAKRWKSRWDAHRNAVFDAIWTPDDTQVLTAAGDREIRLWNVEMAIKCSRGGQTTPLLTLKGHDMSVKCVRQAPHHAHLFASGGRDGKVLLWDTRTSGKPIDTLENVHAEPNTASSNGKPCSSPCFKKRRLSSTFSPSPRSVTCVEFGASSYELFTAGAVDAVVKYWDFRRLNRKTTQMTRQKAVPTCALSCSSQQGARRGISSLAFRRSREGASHLLVNVLNDSIVVLDLGLERPQHQSNKILRCVGHEATSFYSKASFCPQGQFIAGSSADGIVYVWDARTSTVCDEKLESSPFQRLETVRRLPYLALKGHTKEVNGVAWGVQDCPQLASCSDDGTVRCWQVGGKRVERLKAAEFQLRRASSATSSDVTGRRQWKNWHDFDHQPNGFAYRVQGPSVSRSSVTSKPRADTHSKSDQVSRIARHSRVDSNYETRVKAQRGMQEPPTRRFTCRRKAKLFSVSKQAQRTLVDLWKMTEEQGNSHDSVK